MQNFDNLYSKLFNEMPVTLPAPTKPAPTRTPTPTRTTPSRPARPDRPWLPAKPQVAPKPKAAMNNADFFEDEETPDDSIANRDVKIHAQRKHKNGKVL